MTRVFTTTFLLLLGWAAPALAQPVVLPASVTLPDEPAWARTIALRVRLHATAASPEVLFEETVSVGVEQGRGTFLIGETTTLDATVLAARDQLFAELTVDGTVLAPRVAVGTTPYAAVAVLAADAETVGGRTAADFARDGHTHTWSSIFGGATFPPSAHRHDWSELTAVPATFPPSAHTHAWADLDAIPAGFADGDDAGGDGDITGVIAGSGLTGGGTTGDVTVSLGTGALTSLHVADGTVAIADVASRAPLRTRTSAWPANQCVAQLYRGNVATSYVRNCTTVTCPDAPAGGHADCVCPAPRAVAAVYYEDIDGDGDQVDRIVRLACCTLPY